MKVAYLIDGFNFYHSIKSSSFKSSTPGRVKVQFHPKSWRWFDYVAYCHRFLQKDEEIYKIFYFTALAVNDPESKTRHLTYIPVLVDAGVQVVYGKYKRKTRKCFKCGYTWEHPEEKATDVNIAVEAYALACSKAVDKIYVISGDTDYLPALRRIEHDFPSVKVEIIFPFFRESKEYLHARFKCHYTQKSDIQQSLLPRFVTLSNGVSVERPREWAD